MQTPLLLISFICNTLLGLVLLAKSKSNESRLGMAISILGLAGWNLSILMLIYDPSVIHPPSIWGKLASTFAIFVPMGLLWFAKTFRREKALKKLRSYWFVALTIIVALLTLPDNFLFYGELTLANGGIEQNVGFYTSVIGIYYLVYFVLAFFNLIKVIKNSKNTIVRSQMLHITFSFIFVISLALVTNLVLPIIGIFDFNGLGPILSILLAFNLFYAATHKRLPDFKLLLQKSLSYLIATLITASVVFFFVPSLPSYTYLKVAIIFFAILSFVPIQKSFYVILNYIFFRKRSNYKDILRQVNIHYKDGMDIQTIFNNLSQTFINCFKIKGFGILLKDRNDSWNPAFASNINGKSLSNPSVINWIEENNTMFIRDEALYLNKFPGINSQAIIPLEKEETEYISAIYIPVIFDGTLQAILVFEDKINNTAFNNQEIKEIELLLNKISYFFVSASRYQQIKEDVNNKHKVKKYFKEGLFHEVNTPLTIANNFIEMVKWSEKSKKNLNSLKKAQDYLKKSSDVVTNIVELNQLVSGESELLFEKCKLSELIESTLQSTNIQNIIKEKEIDVILDNSSIANLYANCDKNYLVKALVTMLMNVFDSIDVKSSIEIKAKKSNETIQILIKSPKSINKDEIGISFSKLILERHKGNLDIQPDSTINIELPI